MPTPKSDFWYGIGISVEAQSVVMGVSSMIARMASYNQPGANCLIQLSGVQFGPGLGGSASAMLLIATGASSPIDFPALKVESGWDLNLSRLVSVTELPGNVVRVAHVIATIPKSELIDFALDHPSYLFKLRDSVGALVKSLQVAVADFLRVKKLNAYPVAGGGFQASLTYHCCNHIKLLAAAEAH